MNTVNVTVKENDTDGLPIADVEVLVKSAYGNLLEVGRTNAGGTVTFALDDGGLVVLLRKHGAGLLFSNPETLTVAGDTSVEYFATPTLVQPESSPTLARVYGFLAELGLDPRPDVDVMAEVYEPRKGAFANATIVSGSQLTTQTDDAGFFAVDLPIASDVCPSTTQYRIQIPAAGFEKVFLASALGDGGTVRLVDLLD